MRYHLHMIHFIVSDDQDQTDEELLALLEKSGAALALRAVKEHLADKDIKRIIVGPNFINIVTK